MSVTQTLFCACVASFPAPGVRLIFLGFASPSLTFAPCSISFILWPDFISSSALQHILPILPAWLQIVAFLRSFLVLFSPLFPFVFYPVKLNYAFSLRLHISQRSYVVNGVPARTACVFGLALTLWPVTALGDGTASPTTCSSPLWWCVPWFEVYVSMFTTCLWGGIGELRSKQSREKERYETNLGERSL